MEACLKPWERINMQKLGSTGANLAKMRRGCYSDPFSLIPFQENNLHGDNCIRIIFALYSVEVIIRACIHQCSPSSP